jgi:hypothetical protein
MERNGASSLVCLCLSRISHETEIKIKKVQKDAHEKNSKTITSDGPCVSNKLQLKEMLAAPFFSHR